MLYLTVLLGSLLSMLGIHEPPGQTSITRLSGEHALLSRTTVMAGVSRFQCLQSDSGRCGYRLYHEQCQAREGGQECRREPLADFTLVVGSSRELRDLPRGFGQQVHIPK
ncbi:hypothetical protein ARC78_11245 [Stenotrophomonas pictorum JCM 9942]|uniref:Uncharacterized protein n=1 Tax=Stenotrophomonas pictorum JCM 9942 TaxID=1236960 RepID=A0A0R0AHT4_9GAMM|nr:hypothetical protein [Stenotrophomonas pictorum]KRG41326.1 hypothetical protein ARC78_11245 [Stenotrophomonas pictorum JCM 9942]